MGVWTGTGQIISVDNTPQVFPFNWVSKVTTNTVILTKPWCFFDNLTCTDCEVWLVPAIDAGQNNFDTDKNASNIISLSPYPSAFSADTSKKYFLTKVGLKQDFPCSPITGPIYFVVGSDGNCSSNNCNGVLPVGSTVSCCRQTKQQSLQVTDSLRIRKYDTHNLKDQSPYSNHAYEDDSGRFASAEPKRYGDVKEQTNPIRLKSYTDYDVHVKKPATEL
ncbi:uroplakin-3b [Aplochiton taeniatus]